jgi:hypothetical protein
VAPHQQIQSSEALLASSSSAAGERRAPMPAMASALSPPIYPFFPDDFPESGQQKKVGKCFVGEHKKSAICPAHSPPFCIAPRRSSISSVATFFLLRFNPFKPPFPF